MKSATAGSLALLLISQLAQAGEKVSLNTITKVQVNGNAVEIVGNQKPNFTTFTMTDPPRLVVDISEAVFSGVPEQMDVANGPIMGIKTASYGSDASAIARVLIGFHKDVDTDIQVKGTSLLIRTTSSGAAPAVAEEKAAGKPAVAAAAGAKDQEKVAAQAARAEQERQAEQQRLAEQERKAEEARLAKAEEARKREEAKQAAVSEKERQKEAAEAKRRAADEEKQAKLAAAEEKKRQEVEAREEKKREAEQAKLAKQQAAGEAKLAAAKAAEDARLAKQRAAEDARLAKQQVADEAKLAKQTTAQEAEIARNQPAEDSRPARPTERIGVSSRRKTVAQLGFKQQAAASRVFVRTNEPVRYSVSEGQGRTVILELENTSIGPRNNSRFLDTSYFDTAVAMVSPSQGPTRSVRIEIRLKEAVPFEAHQEGNEVFLDFPRPAKR